MLPLLDNAYLTQDGDMLDDIVLRHYGRGSLDVFLPVCQANIWLLQLPLRLPLGRSITLPAVASVAPAPQVLVMWQDSPPTADVATPSKLTNTPSGEFDGYLTVQDYLAHYTRLQSQQGSAFVKLVQSSQPFNGTLLSGGSKILTYSPQVGFVGTDSFLLTATDGTLTDTDLIQIVVPSTGVVARYEIFSASSAARVTSRLMFVAVKATTLVSVQAFLGSAENLVAQSHIGGNNLAYLDVTLSKRLVSGGLIPLANTARLTDTIRTSSLQPTTALLSPGEGLVANLTSVNGNVLGLYIDVYSIIAQ